MKVQDSGPEGPSEAGDQVGGGQHQEEPEADEEDPGQLHPVVREGEEVVLDVVQGGGGDGGDQAQRDEVLVGDHHAQVGQHVGHCGECYINESSVWTSQDLNETPFLVFFE